MKMTLPKESLLSKPWQYNHVYRNGKRVRGKGITLIFMLNGNQDDRLGISISGARLAIRRNRTKRLIKEFYRHNRLFPSLVAGRQTPGVDLIFATNKQFTPSGLHDIESALSPFYPNRQIRAGADRDRAAS